MLNFSLKLLSLFLALIMFSCAAQNYNTKTKTVLRTLKWDFNDLNEWDDATQVGEANYSIEDGKLRMFTHANTWERTKLKSAAKYREGSYSWRVYIPKLGKGDMTSIGAFLYANNSHEIDFEIGYGDKELRKELNAQSNEVVVYMTSQSNPHYSFLSKIETEKWHTLNITLQLNSKKKYVATWKIDDTTMTSTTLNYGKRSKFKIFCSVENLHFMGDHIPTFQNYTLFDFVEYTGD